MPEPVTSDMNNTHTAAVTMTKFIDATTVVQYSSNIMSDVKSKGDHFPEQMALPNLSQNFPIHTV